jgi:hypothetical protein
MQPRHDEIRGILPNDPRVTHIESILKKVREKICLSIAVDGEINRQRAHVCMVCHCLVIGLEEVKFIDKSMLLNHSNPLCVSAYEDYDGVPLDAELVKHYQVLDDDLKNLLLPGSVFILLAMNAVKSCYRSLGCSKRRMMTNHQNFI